MSQRLLSYVMLMFLSPALSLFNALKTNDRDLKRWVFIIFITFYGSIITLSETNDGTRHLNRVYNHYTTLSLPQFLSEAFDIITFKTNEDVDEDLYIHFLSYLTGGVLRIPGAFFIFVSFVYAYFFSGSIFRLFQLFPLPRQSIIFFGLALVFLLWKNIDGINTVRTWTGLWVLFYSCLSYYSTKKKKYLLLMFFPPLIHIGYIIMALPAWIVLFFGVRKLLYSILFILSFSVTFINPPSITGQLEQTEVGKEMVGGYYTDETDAEDTEGQTQSGAWYYQLFLQGYQDWGIVLVAVMMIIFGAYKNYMNAVESSLFSIGLLTKVLANSSSFLFAVANRSDIIAGLFILSALLLLWQRGYFHQKTASVIWQKFLLGAALIIFLPFIVYKVANLIYFLSAFLLLVPFVPWIYNEWNISLRELIGFFLGE